jgi:spore maturation protein CgeB
MGCGARGLQIVIFGLSITSSWGNGHASTYRSLLPALAARGHKIVFYERNVEYYAARRDLFSAEYADVVLYESWDDIRQRALPQARAADLVMTTSFCPDGAQIQTELFAQSGPLKVFYDLDTPVTLAGLRAGAPEALVYLRPEHIPEFDVYFSFSGGPTLLELERVWGARRAVPLYLCIDPRDYRRTAAVPDYACNLSFLGTYSADRRVRIEQLFLKPAERLPQLRFLMAGPFYPADMRVTANVRRLDHLPAREHAAFYSSCEFTLNLTRAAMLNAGYSPQGRLFEAACCGTAILTDRWPGLEQFFQAGSEITVVETSDDVCTALQSISESEREAMAQRCRERVIASHSGQQRAAEFEQAIEAAFSQVASKK